MSEVEKKSIDVCKILIRRVTNFDFKSVVQLFRTFDFEKYEHLRTADLEDSDEDDVDDPEPRNEDKELVGIRIDDKGGIYLQPHMDTNAAYFKSFVAEDLSTRQLIGYVLFFNTLDERSVGAGGNCADDPVAVIEDLYVDQEYRRRGIATQLFTKVLGSSLERGCFSLEWPLLSAHSSSDGIAFWKSRVGASRIEAIIKKADLDGKRRKMRSKLNLDDLNPKATNEVVVELDRNEMRRMYNLIKRNSDVKEGIVEGHGGSSDGFPDLLCF